MQTVTVATDGGDIAVAVRHADHADLPAVCFLHGWTLDRRMWAPQIGDASGAGLRNLSFITTTLALDRRGFGQSSAPADLTAEADDIRRVLDRLAIERVVLVGMSQAARVAVDFSQRHRERLLGLVLHGAPPMGLQEPTARAEIPLPLYQRLVREGRLEELRSLWGAHPLMQAYSTRGRTYLAEALAAYAGRDLAVAAPDHAWPFADLAAIGVPTLVLTGERDTQIRRDAAKAIAHDIPDGRHREIEGGGHLCNLCAPEVYNEALRDFLASLC